MSATYHVYPKQEWFVSFEKLDGGLVPFDDGHTCQIEEIGTIRIKLCDGMGRELKDVRYISIEDEPYLSWSFEDAGPEENSWRRRSQDVQ